MFIEILLASFVVMLAALGGALTFWKVLGRTVERHLAILISFASGLFLFVSFELGREAIAHSPSTGDGLVWIFAGAIGVWLIFTLLPHSHDHDHESTKADAPRRTLDIRKILTGNGIHNVGDGVLLAAAFSVDVYLGIVTTVSVFVHELVQETGIFFVLRKAGCSIKKAVLINFSVSATILIGSLGGVILIDTFTAFEAPLLGISAGAFLIVVLQDLIPQSIRESRHDRRFLSHILAFALGLGIMFSVSLLVPHDHDALHDHDDHEHGHEHTHEHGDEHSGEHDHSEEHHDHSDDDRHHTDEYHNEDHHSGDGEHGHDHEEEHHPHGN